MPAPAVLRAVWWILTALVDDFEGSREELSRAIDLAAENLGLQEWSGIEPPNFVIQKLNGVRGALLAQLPVKTDKKKK